MKTIKEVKKLLTDKHQYLTVGDAGDILESIIHLEFEVEREKEEIRKDQMDKSARSVKFSAERFFFDNGSKDVGYAIMVSDAEAAIKEK